MSIEKPSQLLLAMKRLGFDPSKDFDENFLDNLDEEQVESLFFHVESSVKSALVDRIVQQLRGEIDPVWPVK